MHDNKDGTFSILDPKTSAPYPGTLGMEKEKPFCCEVCGKRYKNLNGLKYHRQHQDSCNQELRVTSAAALANMNLSGLEGLGLMGSLGPGGELLSPVHSQTFELDMTGIENSIASYTPRESVAPEDVLMDSAGISGHR